MKEKILELRKQGKNYKQIQEELGCSKGTISYYCGTNQKEKTLIRSKKRRNLTNNLTRKVENFLKGPARHKVDRFQKRFGRKGFHELDNKFTWKSVVEKFGEETKCYLTGEKLNLLKDNNYQFDHIIPSTRGGLNTIENLGILHETVNKMKGNLLNEELISWCKKILVYQGYSISKNTKVTKLADVSSCLGDVESEIGKI